MSSQTVEEQSLKRDVGWYGSFCMGYADVGADIFLALGLVALYAAGGSPLAFGIASVTYVCTGLAYAELASTFPYAGGAHVYSMKAFNDLGGFVAGWAVMLDYTVDIGLFSLAAAGYLSFFVPWLKTESVKFVILGFPVAIHFLGLTAAIMVSFLIALNIIGIRESSHFNEVLVAVALFVLAAILILGLSLAFKPKIFIDQIQLLGAPSKLPNIQYLFSSLGTRSQNFIYGVTIAMTSFIGIESIAQAAEETKRPSRWIPRANKLSIISVMVFALGLSVLSIGMMPWEELAAAQADPIASLAARIPLVGTYVAPIVAITGLLICYVSTNTGVIGVSRIAFSMGKFQLLPKWFHKVHPRFRTPIRTVVVFSFLGALLALTGELTFVADLYNFGAILSYVMVNFSIIVLRNKIPEAYRPWKIPGTVSVKIGRGVLQLPVVSVIGVIGTAVIWLLILGFHEGGRVLGSIWIAVGLALFAIFRHTQRIPILRSTSSEAIVPGAYTINAAVLVRTPEDEQAIAQSVKDALDPRFNVTILTIIDPEDYGLHLDTIRDFEQIKQIEDSARDNLTEIAKRLHDTGFSTHVRVRVGNFRDILDNELQSSENDVVALVKRKTLRAHIEKEREESALALASRYPGKLMIIRRAS